MPDGLSKDQERQAQDRAREAKATAEVRLIAAYQWLLVPRQETATAPVTWGEHKLDGDGNLSKRTTAKLRQAGALYAEYPPVFLRLHLEGALSTWWKDGSVPAERLWDAYSRYLYLHRLRGVDTLLRCVAKGPGDTTWTNEGFAIAEAVDPRDSTRFVGLVTSGEATGVRGATLVVRPDLALAQLDAERREAERQRDGHEGDGGPDGTGDEEGREGMGRSRRGCR